MSYRNFSTLSDRTWNVFLSSTEKGPRSCDWLKVKIMKKKWFHMIMLNFILWKKLRHNTKVSHTSLRHLISVLAPPEISPRHVGFSLTFHLFFTQTQAIFTLFWHFVDPWFDCYEIFQVLIDASVTSCTRV